MARLRRSACTEPGIVRRRRGRGFAYVGPDGLRLTDTEAIARVESLVIPPAWQDVWICVSPHGHLQAVGTDAAGRRQYLYHPQWRSRQDRAKFDRIIRELSVHATVEEVIFYPAIREMAEQKNDVDDMVLESLEEHHVLKWTLKELEGMDPAHERFDAKVTVLMESVRHHVKEEEKDLFPAVRKLFDRAHLAEMGDAMAELKKTAPTRPHPKAPDEPPGNLVTGAAAAIADRTLEAGRRLLRSA